ncbi:MAG: hypothetical protein ACYTEZ_19045 [Planctomycetota bacterium]|jgi:hypothetical protein
MDRKHEEEMLETLRSIAAGVDRIGAALTVEVCDQLKSEVIGGSEVSSETQVVLMNAEKLRDKALSLLARSYGGR